MNHALVVAITKVLTLDHSLSAQHGCSENRSRCASEEKDRQQQHGVFRR